MSLAPLHPWAARPDRRLIELAPEGFWRAHAALPMRLDEKGLVVATSAPLDAIAERALRASSGQPVQQVSAARDEILFWLDLLEGRRGWAEALALDLAGLARQLGLHLPTRVEPPDTAQEALSVDQAAASLGISEQTALELLALRARVAWVRLANYHPAPYLTGVLPRHEAEIMRVVPLVARRGLVLLASPRVFGEPVLKRLHELIGLEPRMVVCSPADFQDTFVRVFGESAVAPAPELSPPSDAAIFEALSELGVVTPNRHEALRGLAHVTSESAVEAGLRLGYLSRDHVRAARARATRLAPLDAGQLKLHAELAAHGAPTLWRRLRCAPVRRGGRGAVLACEAPLAPAAVELVRHLMGATELTLRQALPDEIDRLLEHVPPAEPKDYTAEDHLIESGQVSPAQAARARRAAEREGVSLIEALLVAGSVSIEDVVEARAVALGRPWLRLDQFAPEPGLTELVSEHLARAEQALPLRRHGDSLTVARLNGPTDATSSGREDEGRGSAPRPLDASAASPLLIEQATGLAVDPVLAVVEDPERAFNRWYSPERPDVPPAYADFGQVLVRRGLLDRAELDGLWGTVDRRLDAALVGRGKLTPDSLRDALAEHLGVQTIDLTIRHRRVELIDALGVPRTELTWDDPVDRDLARRVPPRLAAKHGFTPVGRIGARTQVAFWNPLDAEAVEAAQTALGESIEVCVATRRDIELAQRRVYAGRSLGERLLEAGIVSGDQLERALQVHEQAGVRLGQALVNMGFVTELELAATLADQAGVAFVDLVGVEPDESVVRKLPPEVARERGVLPLYDDGEAIVVGCTDTAATDALSPWLGEAVKPVVVTESAFDDALNRVWRDEFLEHSASLLVRRAPADSARWVLSRGQKVFFGCLLSAISAGLLMAPTTTLTALITFATCFYLAFSTYKFYLAYRAVQHTLEVETTAEEIADLDDRDLPVYTILVPVYREAEVFPILAAAIDKLDYPKAKLDVKILLEEDDHETIAVARASRLPSHFKLVVVPNGQPRGKPKACNYGLIHAQGEFVVIFDAEDIPEPDQLKKALIAFRKGGADLVCVQAKLNYFNRDQNLLTRWFTTEYSMWFDLFLPGLDASGAPIPLGGTSNHFRTDKLRELGAWDPHNVTEDADLGMRLYKAGSKTAVIDSTTYEEANSELYNWIRQRSRWVKGYIQTYLVHMRHPLRLWRSVGPRAFLSFQLVVGGTFFGFLVNPVFWVLTALWFTTHWILIKEIFPGVVFYMGAIGLYLGNFAFAYLNVAGCLRRGYYGMVKYALLSPVYWALMSIAAWKGFLQLFYAPSYWEKTTHGLYQRSSVPVATVTLETHAV